MSHRQSQEDRERWLTEEFLRSCGWRFSDLKTLSQFKTGNPNKDISGPDIKVSCVVDQKELRLGVEVTEYLSDDAGKGSPARSVYNMWRNVWGTLDRELFRRHLQFQQFSGRAAFDSRSVAAVPRPGEARELAAELVNCLLPKLGTVQEAHEFRRKKDPGRSGDFEGFPLVKKYLTEVRVTRMDRSLQGPFYWDYVYNVPISVSPGKVSRIIRKKGGKCGGFDWSGTDEKWLLICAAGITCAGRLLPGPETEKQLRAPEIVTAARHTPFDRVFFWERVRKWHLDLKA